MEKILVVNVNWLGDVIFSSPVFKALRHKYPDAHISCMAVPRVKEILQCIDSIDEIIEYDEDDQHKSLFSKIKLVGHLKKKEFSQVFLLSRSFSRASMMALAKIPVRVGYENKNRGKFLTHVIEKPKGDVHRSDYYLNVVESYGVNISDRTTELSVSQEQEESVSELLKKHQIDEKDYVIALNPGGNWDLKRWPQESFSKLIDYINQNLDAKIVMTGSDKDKDLVEEICSNISTHNKPIMLTGQLTLKELMALLKRVDIFISADSGPIHIASSVGCKSIAIFGPTRPELTGPRGKTKSFILQKDVGCNKQACYFLDCQDNICMQAVTVKDIYDTIKKIKS